VTGIIDAVGCAGFRLVPGGTNPDSYPVLVNLNREAAPITVPDGAPMYFEKPLEALQVIGTPNRTWVIQTVDKGERFGAPATATRKQLVNLLASKSLTTVAPAALTPSAALLSHPFVVPAQWCGGVMRITVRDTTNPRTLRKWILPYAGATWYPAGQLAATDIANDCTLELSITAPCAGLYLQVADAFGALTVDVDIEVPL
jgi:hypothetical protein